jgi:hypothetical protein
MRNGIHFISGLPRAGSALLAALLRQNPRFSAGMTSPVGSLFNAMLSVTSQRNETAVFIDNARRERLLRGLLPRYPSAPGCIRYERAMDNQVTRADQIISRGADHLLRA